MQRDWAQSLGRLCAVVSASELACEQVMNAELLAGLEEGEDRSQQLEATLQEKESQLSQLTELQKVSATAPQHLHVLHETPSHALGIYR